MADSQTYFVNKFTKQNSPHLKVKYWLIRSTKRLKISQLQCLRHSCRLSLIVLITKTLQTYYSFYSSYERVYGRGGVGRNMDCRQTRGMQSASGYMNRFRWRIYVYSSFSLTSVLLFFNIIWLQAKLFMVPVRAGHVCLISVIVAFAVLVHQLDIIYFIHKWNAWWRHQMETFSALLAICAGNSPVSGEFPAQRPVTRSFDVFFDLCPNKRLSEHSWGWWLRRHRAHYDVTVMDMV